MKREKQKRTRIIIALTAVLLLMTVGYAAYNTNLNITGTSNISNSWDIEITNISDPVITGSAKHVAKEIGTNKLSASMEADLYDEGDSAEYTVTIQNKGSVDAALDSISKDTSDSNENIDITFKNYTKGERLSAGDTMDIQVKIAYPSSTAFNTNNINNNIKLMSTNTLATGEVRITFNFVQAEGYEDSEDFPIPDTYLVEYDCTTNGGKDCTEYNEYLKEGESIDLSHTGTNNSNNKLIFLGWNTDKDATDKLDILTVTSDIIDENNKVKLYAIYEPVLKTPTFTETVLTSSAKVTITFPSGCGESYTCQYQKDSGSFTNVTTNTVDVTFTAPGTLVAKTSYDTDELSSSYTVSLTAHTNTTTTLGTITETYDECGDYEIFTAPKSTTYTLNVYGASGGKSYKSSGKGGKGGYAKGTITLSEGDKLYIFVGCEGETGGLNYRAAGGYNGGGKGGYYGGGGGGGATDIRVNSTSTNARVIVAGGGGGGAYYSGYSGGAGGGTSGDAGKTAGGGTQTAGGAAGSSKYVAGNDGSFGKGGSATSKSSGDYVKCGLSGGGGGGWFGGGSGGYNGTDNTKCSAGASGGGGGSGFVYKTSNSNCTLDSKYYLTSASTTSGARSGDGKATITYTGDTTTTTTTYTNDKLSLSASSTYTEITATATSNLYNITKYEFKIGDNDWVDNGTNTTYEFTGLNHNTSYTIQVRATTPDGKITASTTKTTTTLPAPTIETTPSYTSITATATSALDNITKYEFKIGDNDWVDNGTNTTYEFTGLNQNTSYNIQVRITYKGVTTTTKSATTITSTFPLTLTTTPTINTINVEATVSDEEKNNITKYEFKIGDNDWVDNGTNTTYKFTGLNQDTSYNIQVRITHNNIGKMTKTETIKTSAVPLTLTTTPAISNINVEATVSDEEKNNITKYEFKIGDNDWVDNGTDSTYEFTGLNQDTSYTVQVRITHKDVGTTTKSSTVKTNAIPLTINTTKTTSTINAVAVVSDEEKNNITKYEFKIGSNDWVDNGTNATYNFTGLRHNTSYTVQVKATYKGITSTTKSSTVSTTKINTPTFQDTETSSGTNVTINYPSITINGETISNICADNGNYKCEYKLDTDTNWTTVTTSTKDVSYTTVGTYNIIARITDKTYTSNVVTTSTYTITVYQKVTIGNNKYSLHTAGDGLYTDGNNIDSGTRYIYRGTTPNNYICLGTISSGTCPSDSLYRIVALEADQTIKVIKNTSIGKMVFDFGEESTYSYNNTTITSENSLSGTRYQGPDMSSYYCTKDTSVGYLSEDSVKYLGCNSWGSASSTLATNGTSTSSAMPKFNGSQYVTYSLPTYNSWLNIYLNGGTYHQLTSTININSWYADSTNGLSSASKTKIVTNHVYSIGPIWHGDYNTLIQDKTKEATYKWKGTVGLVSVLDYISASLGDNCTSLSDHSGCYLNNWLNNGEAYWTITPYLHNSSHYIWAPMNQYIVSALVSGSYAVRPVMFLNSSTKLSGSGTETDPYVITN